jgi:hypothetical protein
MCSMERVKQQLQSLWMDVRYINISTVFHSSALVSVKCFPSNLTLIRNEVHFYVESERFMAL